VKSIPGFAYIAGPSVFGGGCVSGDDGGPDRFQERGDPADVEADAGVSFV